MGSTDLSRENKQLIMEIIKKMKELETSNPFEDAEGNIKATPPVPDLKDAIIEGIKLVWNEAKGNEIDKRTCVTKYLDEATDEKYKHRVAITQIVVKGIVAIVGILALGGSGYRAFSFLIGL